jgi:hypothetical protein
VQNERLWNTASSDFTPSPSQVRFAPTTPDGAHYGNWNLLGSPRFEDFDAPLLASAATLSSYKASAEKGVSGFTNTAMVTLPEMHEGGASSPSEGPQEGVKRPKKDHKGALGGPGPCKYASES